MKHFTLIFAACLCIAIVAVPQPKTKAVPVDEVELMLEKISSHLQEASVATAQAHKMSDKMVEEKVAAQQSKRKKFHQLLKYDLFENYKGKSIEEQK